MTPYELGGRQRQGARPGLLNLPRANRPGLVACPRRLRGQDAEFQRRERLVRHGKSGKDRVPVLPVNPLLPLQPHLARAKPLRDDDLAAGFRAVWLPDALAVKYPDGAGAAGTLRREDDIDLRARAQAGWRGVRSPSDQI